MPSGADTASMTSIIAAFMEVANTDTILLIGRPGSGKGTQAKLIAAKRGWTHFSTGDLFKALRDGEGALAERVRTVYDSGKLLPDWFATYLFEDVMFNLSPGTGVVAEGYPRSISQAEMFVDILSWLDRSLKVIYIDVSEQEALRRMMERAKTEHRPDSDAEEKIRVRFDEFTKNTEPLLAYFKEKGLLVDIEGEQTPEEVEAAIAAALT
jgi:adenylate kinase